MNQLHRYTEMEKKIRLVFTTNLSTEIKFSLICGLISDSFGAGSTSLLVYSAEENSLKCEGRSISIKFLESSKLKETNYSLYLYLKYHNYFLLRFSLSTDHEETLKNSNGILFLDDSDIPPKDDLELVRGRMKKLETIHSKYLSVLREERDHKFEGNRSSSVSAFLFYSSVINILEKSTSLDFDNFKYLDDVLVRGYSPSLDYTSCRKGFREIFGIDLKKSGCTVFLPIRLNDQRLIGILRVQFAMNNLLSGASLNETNISINSKYKEKFKSLKVISELLGDKLSVYKNLKDFRKFYLRSFVKGRAGHDWNDYCDLLSSILNCYGAILRLSNANSDAKIIGCSRLLKTYCESLGDNDPYISKGFFREEIIAILENNRFGDDNIVAIKMRDGVFGSQQIKVYFTNNESIVEQDASDSLGSECYTNLFRLLLEFKSHNLNHDFGEVVIIPLRGINYGFITLAQPGVLSISSEDIHLILPIVSIISDQITSLRETEEKLKIEQRNAIEVARSIYFHQLNAPLVENLDAIDDLKRQAQKGELSSATLINRLDDLLLGLEHFNTNVSLNKMFLKIANNEKLHVEKSRVQLHNFIIEKIRPYQRRIDLDKKFRIEVIQIPSSNRMYSVETSPDLLSNALQCIIDNAVKYSFSVKGIEDYMKVNRNSARPQPFIIIEWFIDKEEWSISVTNWGVEFPVAEVEEIIKVNVRGTNVLGHESTGSGIGLFLVNYICQLLAGELYFRSNGPKTTVGMIFKRKSNEYEK